MSSVEDMLVGYSAITFSVGEPEDVIFVVSDSSLACFRSKVEVPDDTEDKPTTIVLTMAVVPIPAEGLK